MMKTERTPGALGSHDQLGPLLEGWANVECVRFVNRSTGQRTTETVSRAGLMDLMRAVQAAERERHAKKRSALVAAAEMLERMAGGDSVTMAAVSEMAEHIRRALRA